MRNRKVKTIVMSKQVTQKPGNVGRTSHVPGPVSYRSDTKKNRPHIISNYPPPEVKARNTSRGHPRAGTIFSEISVKNDVKACRIFRGVLPRKISQTKKFSIGICNTQLNISFLLTSLLDTGDKLSNVVLFGNIKSRPKTTVNYSLVLTDKNKTVLKTIMTGDARVFNDVKIGDIVVEESGYIMLLVTKVEGRLNDVGLINLSYTYFGY